MASSLVHVVDDHQSRIRHAPILAVHRSPSSITRYLYLLRTCMRPASGYRFTALMYGIVIHPIFDLVVSASKVRARIIDTEIDVVD